MAKVSIFQVFKLLPQTDCKKCGCTCMAFSGYLIARDVKPVDCPPLMEDGNENLEKLYDLLGDFGDEKEITGLMIDSKKCSGCGICVSVCESNIANSREIAFGKGPRSDDMVAIRIDDGLIKLIDANLCTRSVPAAVRCKSCVEYCPDNAIDLV